MSQRAEQLAKRIEDGANNLATFCETLSDADWKKSVGGRDGRPVGVCVHHVASVYPIEADLAQKAGAGNDLSGVTWEVVADMNANHAKTNANVSRQEALALLRANAKAAANAVRSMTDAQLDTAVPFGLSFNAPVTAQFVIEDHALRHSWHHLARIKAALGR